VQVTALFGTAWRSAVLFTLFCACLSRAPQLEHQPIEGPLCQADRTITSIALGHWELRFLTGNHLIQQLTDEA
jgi:hypothetical protein